MPNRTPRTHRFADRSRGWRPAVFALAVALGWLLLGERAAWAHGFGTSRGDYRQHPGGAEAWISLPRVDLLMLAPALDQNGDGELQSEELVASEKVNEQLLAALPATRGDAACAGAVLTVEPDKADALFGVRYGPCPGSANEITVHIGTLLSKLPLGHTQAAFLHVGDAEPEQSLVYGKDANVRVPVAPDAAPLAARSRREIVSQGLALGVKQIATGLDHVLFLVGLLLLGGRTRDLVKMVTAFAVAHSLTLALTALGVLAPSIRIVGPLLALSVAYVGVDNLVAPDVAQRWRLAALFGLMHGFGLAAALGARLPRDQLPLALGSFNLGVELGQLGLLLLVIPLLALLRKQPWFAPRGVQLLSAAVVLAGLYVFVQRVFVA